MFSSNFTSPDFFLMIDHWIISSGNIQSRIFEFDAVIKKNQKRLMSLVNSDRPVDKDELKKDKVLSNISKLCTRLKLNYFD